MSKLFFRSFSYLVVTAMCGLLLPYTYAGETTYLSNIDFESDKLDQTAADLGWTKRYGNGDIKNWKLTKPAHSGNSSNAVLNLRSADLQILHPLQLSSPIAASTQTLYLTVQLHGSVLSGAAQPLRLAIASKDLKGVTPFFGFINDHSKEGGKMDLLRFYVGNTRSGDKVAPNHWYELQLVVTVDAHHPTACRASLYYKDMTQNDKAFTLAAGLKNVEFTLRKKAMPQHWGHWQLRGSYAGQIDNLAIGLGSGAAGNMQTSVPWTPSELPGGPVFAPITHQKDWKSERDLFGYNPAFIPNLVSFDANNKPYMRQGYYFWSKKKRIKRNPAAIQTLTSDNQWTTLDFTAEIYKKFSWWDGQMATGPFTNERITFDNQGGMYTIVDAQRSNIGRVYLFYRPTSDANWQLYELPHGWTAMEAQDGHNRFDNPPAILTMNDQILRLVLPTKTKAGKLKIGKPILVTSDSLLVPNHSGGANSSFTINHKTYVVWASNKPIEGQEGTPQYIAVYDHQTGMISDAVLLGVCGHSKPDNHNLPAITVDSKGIFHVVLGAHHDQFEYTHSLKPYDISSWRKTEPFGLPKNQKKWGSYTYVSLLCDAQDNLHVVGRWAGAGYYFRLVYMRKKVGQDWEPHRYLMVPFRNMYSCWYHKLSVDRKGRMFLNYTYYANQLGKDHMASYLAKWPDETPKQPTKNVASNWLWGLTPHDPGMLVSDDSGDTWHLTTTADFIHGMK